VAPAASGPVSSFHATEPDYRAVVTARSAPKEEGFSKDADKLIRRLSLVAFLLTRGGKPVRAKDVRRQVEGYPGMTDDAFKRRFYEDRAELAALGITIGSEPDPDNAGELYSLPAASYYLPAVELSPEELASLGACLLVLGERFAYSHPLRLALLSLAQGRPELLQDSSAPPLAVLPQADAQRATSRLPKLQAAIAERKTVTFGYYAIHRDEEMQRTVDPYGLLMVGDEWYLLAYCHLRQAVRTFRLSRIRSRISHATKAPHDFAPPAGFTLAAYRDRPGWQLDGRLHQAHIRIHSSMAWWVQAHYSHCGVITPQRDGSILYETGYGSAREMLSWVLGLGEEAEIISPPDLRAAAATQLALLRRRLLDPPKPKPAADGGRTPGARTTSGGKATSGGDWHVEVDRFTRLTALATYLMQRCDDLATFSVAEVCRDLGMSPADLKADVRLLNLVNFGGDGSLLFAEVKGAKLEVSCDIAGPALATPARLSPLQADTLLLAVDLVGGQVPSTSASALRSAADKIRAARQTTAQAVTAEDVLTTRDEVLSAVNQAIRERRLMAIDYWSEGKDRTSSRTVEPYLLVRSRGEWFYVCYCRTSSGTRVFRIATTRRAEVLAEHFAPRDDVELDLYRREGVPPTARYAARSARVWYSKQVARWIAERQPVTPCTGGTCLADQPYLDQPWLIHYLLRFGGEAVPLAPADASAALLAVVERLLERYGGVA
jgi:proteasome accessory factor BC